MHNSPSQKLCTFPKIKSFIKKVEFWPFSMPTNWGTKKFPKTTLTKRCFRRDKWKAFVEPLLPVPWQFHTHLSDTFSLTRAGRPCAMTIFHASDFLGLHYRTATGKATTVGTGQWYFSKELGGSAGVKLPRTRFAVGHQMNPGRTGARSNRCEKI